MTARPISRRALLGAASRSGRAQKRQALGTLKDLRVRAATRKRYAQAYARFSWHVQVFSLTVATFFELDDALTHYFEHLWHEGEPRLWVGDSLAAVHYYLPTSKRQLPVAWSLHKAWGKSELQARACPLTLPMLHGICGLLVQWGFWRDALVALCAFDLVLRTGEALELRGGDIEATKTRVGMVLKLRQTKVGRRRGADEFVVVDDSLVQAALQLLAQDCAPGDLLIGCLPHHWRYRWNSAVRELGLQLLDVRAYSLRRGGATWLFRRLGSFDKCLERGRWGNTRNARRYIEEAAAMSASLRLSDAELSALQAYAERLFNWLKQFIDPVAIQSSVHFSSAATATVPSPLPTGSARDPVQRSSRKRPAAAVPPMAPRPKQPECKRVVTGLQRFFAQRR